jgi:hypothetical protein
MKVQFNDMFVYLPIYPGCNVAYQLQKVAKGEDLPHITSSESGYFEREGNPLIGKATVTIELFKPEEITGKQVEALRQKLQTMRAEHQSAQNALINQISKLEALTFDGAAA